MRDDRNPCAEIFFPLPKIHRFEVGDKIVYKKNGNYAHIIDIIDDSRTKTVYLRRKDGNEIDMPYEHLQQFMEDSGTVLVKQTKLPEDLFNI